MTELRGKILKVPISKVVENNYNYNKMTDEMFEKQIASIARNGFIGVTIVREIEQGGKPFYEIIDGAHRYRAMKSSGEKFIRVNNLGEISDSEAKRLTITLQEIRGEKRKGMFESLLDELESDLSAEEMAELPVPKELLTKLEHESKVAEDSMVDVDFDDSGSGIGGEDNFSTEVTTKPSTPSEPSVYDSQATITLHFSDESWEEMGQGILKKIESVCKKAGGYSENG